MGLFGDKEGDIRTDPRTGLKSVYVGARWIEEAPEVMVSRELMQFFRGKGISPDDAVYLTGWACGFLAGSLIGVPGAAMLVRDHPLILDPVKWIHDAIGAGMEAGKQGQDPAVQARFDAARNRGR